MSKKKTIFSSDTSLEQQFKTLSMRADKRLQRLEKYMTRPGYETLSKGAYARALSDIETWRGKGRKRFGLNPPTNEYDLKGMINDMKAFLRADTSTLKPGIDTQGFNVASYEKGADTFNKRFGSDLTWQEIASFYESKKAQRIAKSIKASKTVAQALGRFKEMYKKNPKLTNAELKRQIKTNPNLKLSDDDAMNEAMKRMIRLGISPKTIFKKG